MKPTLSSSNPSEGDVFLFDLDGVLIRTDTMAAMISRRLRRRPLRLLAVLPLFLAALLTPPENHARARMNRRLVSVALRGLNRETYDQLARKVATDLASGPAVVQQAVKECRYASDAGGTAVVTASEEVIARTYLDAIGLADVPLIASRLEFTGRNPRLKPHNVGAAKLSAIRAAGFSLDQATFYTDSASDLPTARQARLTVIVNAGRRSTTVLTAGARQVISVTWR